MTAEKQRIAIAEACGWRFMARVAEHDPDADRMAYLAGLPPGKQPPHDGEFSVDAEVPNYLNDLNAMYEAEKALTEGQRIDYVAKHLWEIVPAKYCFAHYFWATAAQRAEAFLRTIDKWEVAK